MVDLTLGMTLKEEVLSLVSLRQEGGYWDFKRQWHENNGGLLHDIICMANNLYNRTSYIIIGIDEENGYKVVDIKDDPNRRNTQKIVDFLKDKKFAGGIRPIIHVEQVSFSQGTIDVIVIENSRNTPFYLTEHFEKVRANHIYTRVMDTNTPPNMSADINNVEYLWRKRFRLDETPIGKFHHYLRNPDDWRTIQDQDIGYFYRYSPEYTITCEEDEFADGYEYYMLNQVDTSPSWWLITLKYHQTAIEQFQGLSLDGGRSFVIAPQRMYGLMNVGISAVGYYVYDDLQYRLLQFYHKKETSDEYTYAAYLKTITIFKSEYEYHRFRSYLRDNKGRYDELFAQWDDSVLPSFPKLKGYVMDGFKKDYKDALIIPKMLEEFRGSVQL